MHQKKRQMMPLIVGEGRVEQFGSYHRECFAPFRRATSAVLADEGASEALVGRRRHMESGDDLPRMARKWAVRLAWLQ